MRARLDPNCSEDSTKQTISTTFPLHRGVSGENEILLPRNGNNTVEYHTTIGTLYRINNIL